MERPSLAPKTATLGSIDPLVASGFVLAAALHSKRPRPEATHNKTDPFPGLHRELQHLISEALAARKKTDLLSDAVEALKDPEIGSALTALPDMARVLFCRSLPPSVARPLLERCPPVRRGFRAATDLKRWLLRLGQSLGTEPHLGPGPRKTITMTTKPLDLKPRDAQVTFPRKEPPEAMVPPRAHQSGDTRPAAAIRQQAFQDGVAYAVARNFFWPSSSIPEPLLELSLKTAEILFADGIAQDPSRVVPIIRRALDKLHPAAGQPALISVHPDAVDEVQRELGERFSVVGHAALSPGDCVVQTRRGIIDGRVEVRLAELRAALRGARTAPNAENFPF